MADYREVCQVIRKNADQFREGFYDWMTIFNFQIYQQFEEYADQTRKAGFDHYSARTILEVMRHRTNIREIGNGQWKLNNNLTPDFARLYMLLHPEQDGFFELRERKVA